MYGASFAFLFLFVGVGPAASGEFSDGDADFGLSEVGAGFDVVGSAFFYA